MEPSLANLPIQDKIKASLKGSTGIFLIHELMLPEVPPMTLRFGLAELAHEGWLIRLARGIYYRPPVDDTFHRVLPIPSEVAETVASKSSMKLIPCMEHSAYLCGLDKGAFSPLKWLTDGTSRKLKLYKGPELEFLHTKEARLFTFKSELMRNLSNGLRHVGKENIEDRHLRILREELSKVNPKDFQEDIQKCPEWVRALMLGA